MKQRWINLLNAIKNLPILKQLLDWSKVYSFPGFNNVPLYDVGVFVFKELRRDKITTRANSVAFSFFLAIFPSIIFLFTLLPVIFQPSDFANFLQNVLPQSSAVQDSSSYIDILEQYIRSVFPDNATQYLLSTIEGIIGIQRGGLLSIGFILAIFFSSNGMLTLMTGFDKSYLKTTFKSRSFLTKRIVAILLTGLLIGLFIVSFVLLIIGNILLQYLSERIGLSSESVWGLSLFKGIFAFLVLYAGITSIYKYAPTMRKRIPFINPGSILATILSVITSFGFSYFINNFGRFNELYGSIGALVVIMLWLKFNALILLIGFELNAAIAVNRSLLDASDEI